MDIRISSIADSAIIKDGLRKGKISFKKTAELTSKEISWERGKPLGEDKSEPGWLEKILRDFNDIVCLFDVHLRFSIEKTDNEKTDDLKVKVIDTETEEVIREMPPQKILSIATKLLATISAAMSEET